MQHQHLAGAFGTGANADGRNVQAGGNRGGQRRGDGFENDQAGAGVLLGFGVGEELRRAAVVLALHAVATELMH